MQRSGQSKVDALPSNDFAGQRRDDSTEGLSAKLKALKLDRRTEPSPSESSQPIVRARRGTVAAKPMLLAVVAIVSVGAGYSASFLRTDRIPVQEAAGPKGGSPDRAAPIPSGGLVASGYVVARRQATVAAQVLGQVRAIHVEEGQRVEAGALLASLDASAAQAQTENSSALASVGQSELRSVQARLAEAETMRSRTMELAARGFARQADLTAREADVLSLRSDLAAADSRISAQQATHRAARFVLDRYRIRAPFAGVVTQINAQPGEVISPGSAGGFTRTGICTIVDMQSLEVEVDVAESHIAKVVEGQPVSITLAAYPDRPYAGSVVAVVPIADRARASFQVRIRFQQRDSNILPEMAANVLFKERNAA